MIPFLSHCIFVSLFIEWISSNLKNKLSGGIFFYIPIFIKIVISTSSHLKFTHFCKECKIQAQKFELLFIL